MQVLSNDCNYNTGNWEGGGISSCCLSKYLNPTYENAVFNFNANKVWTQYELTLN